MNHEDSKHKILRLDLYDNDNLCTEIYADYTDKTVRFINHTDDLLRRAFGIKNKADWNDYEDFLEERCVPKTRAGLQYYLEALGLYDFDPLEIIKKTKGKMAEDHQWVEVTEP